MKVDKNGVPLHKGDTVSVTGKVVEVDEAFVRVKFDVHSVRVFPNRLVEKQLGPSTDEVPDTDRV